MNKNLLFIAFAMVFLLISFNVYINSAPSHKEERIYKEIKKYSPYYFEKRFGGLEILSKEDKEFKIKPSNMEVFHKMDELQKTWGKKHLKVEGKNLIIYDSSDKIVKKIPILTEQEMTFLHNFFGV